MESWKKYCFSNRKWCSWSPIAHSETWAWKSINCVLPATSCWMRRDLCLTQQSAFISLSKRESHVYFACSFNTKTVFSAIMFLRSIVILFFYDCCIVYVYEHEREWICMCICRYLYLSTCICMYFLRDMKHCPVQYSSDGSISIGESVLLNISGDEESKNILVSWSHQVCMLNLSPSSETFNF